MEKNYLSYRISDEYIHLYSQFLYQYAIWPQISIFTNDVIRCWPFSCIRLKSIHKHNTISLSIFFISINPLITFCNFNLWWWVISRTTGLSSSSRNFITFFYYILNCLKLSHTHSMITYRPFPITIIHS